MPFDVFSGKTTLSNSLTELRLCHTIKINEIKIAYATEQKQSNIIGSLIVFTKHFRDTN